MKLDYYHYLTSKIQLLIITSVIVHLKKTNVTIYPKELKTSKNDIPHLYQKLAFGLHF